MDKMGVLNIIVMCIIWQINSVGAQENRPQKAGNLKAVENWVLYIKLGNDEVCAGVQLSDDWVLTLADCIDKKIKLTKYSIVHKDDSRKVIAEDRDSFGKLFILLKMTDDKEATKTKFAQLADSMSPSSEYKFSLYNRDNSDKLLANEVDFVRGSQCEKEEIDGNFGETHKCVQGNMNKKARCLSGSPVFGSKKKEILLQGLAVTSTDSCSSQLQSIAVIKPQINWINSIINDCGPIKTFRNGKVKLNKKSSTAIGATASIMCDPGYEATQKKISCKENGKWEKSSCKLKDCGSVENIKNGKLNLDDATKSTMGATATVVCDPGYKANRDKIKCLKSGKWGKSSCEIKDCGPVGNVRKGKVILDNNTESTVGATATLECFPGYKPNQEKLVCLNTGKWDESRCKIKDCGTPASVINGNLNFTTTKFGATASVICDNGFVANQSTISCLDTGSWETPTCTIIDCGTPTSVINGNLNFTSTKFGATASVICDNGFVANQSTISCLDTGSWETPTCTIIDCGTPTSVINGNLSFTATKFGATASVICDNGFVANQSTISCLDTGSWETPTCTIIDCGTPASVINGNLSFTTTKFGATASVICENGFVANQSTISCLDTGSWETPTCTIIDCGSPENVTNGALNFTTTTFGSTAAVVCDNGYAANKTNISCLGSGSWETTGCKDVKTSTSAITTSSTASTTPSSTTSANTNTDSQYGNTCSSDTECTINNSICLAGVCTCEAGYRHESATGICVEKCSEYGTTFIEYVGFGIFTVDLIPGGPLSLTISECMDLCTSTADVLCLGFNYSKGFCKLKSGSPFTHSSSYNAKSGFSYFSRNCL